MKGSQKTSISGSSVREGVLAEVPHTALLGPVDRVGMQGVELPLNLSLPHAHVCVPAQADIQLSLDDEHVRGLHLSRLYNILVQKLSASLFLPHSYRPNVDLIKNLLSECLHSQQGLSRSVFFKLSFVLPVPRRSLVSDRAGWRQYPVHIEASTKIQKTSIQSDSPGNDSHTNNSPGGHNSEGHNPGAAFKASVQLEFDVVLGGEVLYSSTCPCSMALSQQAWGEQLLQDFKQDQAAVQDVKKWLTGSHIAAPHAQRSRVFFKLWLADKCLKGTAQSARPQTDEIESIDVPSYVEIINSIEKSLSTPVQAAVSRCDEKQFARLNAQNPMFCEDAARRLKPCFDQNKNFKDFDLQIQHEESLHPHNVVSRISSRL